MESLERWRWLIAWVVPLVLLGGFLLPLAVRVLREYQRGVVFRLGKLLRAKGPGLVLLIPLVDRIVVVDLRVITIDVPKQDTMTRDNVPVNVDAVLYFRVVEPEAAIVKVEDFLRATSLIAQTTLRSVIGQVGRRPPTWICVTRPRSQVRIPAMSHPASAASASPTRGSLRRAPPPGRC